MANCKITGAAEQKELSIKYIFLKKDGLSFDSLSIAETFKNIAPHYRKKLVLKLPKPPNNFGIQSVSNYYKKGNLQERLLFAKIESDKLFKILKKK